MIQFVQISPEENAELIYQRIQNKFDEVLTAVQTLNSETLLTRTQTCEFFGIEQTTLYHWVKQKRIPMYKVANRCYFKKSELIDSLIQVKV